MTLGLSFSSSGHATAVALTPFSLKKRAVPSVPKMVNPLLTSARAASSMATFSFVPPEEIITAFVGIL